MCAVKVVELVQGCEWLDGVLRGPSVLSQMTLCTHAAQAYARLRQAHLHTPVIGIVGFTQANTGHF